MKICPRLLIFELWDSQEYITGYNFSIFKYNYFWIFWGFWLRPSSQPPPPPPVCLVMECPRGASILFESKSVISKVLMFALNVFPLFAIVSSITFFSHNFLSCYFAMFQVHIKPQPQMVKENGNRVGVDWHLWNVGWQVNRPMGHGLPCVVACEIKYTNCLPNRQRNINWAQLVRPS